MARLDGKIAIVTGGAQGQGAAISRGFVAEGARVVIADVADEPGKALADELGEGAVFAHHDVSSEESWTDVVALAETTFGPVNVLVNNAGILVFSSIDDMSLADYERLISINQTGTWLGMRAVVPTMKRNGGGSIVNASSVEGLGGMPTLSAYVASKWAIRGMTKAIAMECGARGIRANSVHPGMIDTGMTRVHGGDAAMAYGATKVALKRVGSPADMVGVYTFLASDESSFVTGAEIAVDGGATATHAFGG